MATKICAICGKPSGIYPLCKDCFKLRDEGKIEQCPDCKKWHYTNQPCDCKKTTTEEQTAKPRPIWGRYETVTTPFSKPQKTDETQEVIEETQETTEEKNSAITINEQNKSKCITCGIKTDGMLFCKKCYTKYKDKELLFKITACSNVELLDASYEGRLVCKDGHVVKSKSEREIDNYLFEHNIPHAYERELPYGPNATDILHPDFFLKDYLGKDKHVYIEHWGYNENNIEYTKTKKFKLPIYKELGITLICTYEQTDIFQLDAILDRKLNKSFIKENTVNYE